MIEVGGGMCIVTCSS